MQFNSDGNPTVTAMYLVDRGPQGKWYRWYNAETDQWSQAAFHMDEALALKDKPSAVDFFPWVGPLTGSKFNPNKPLVTVTDDAPAPKAKASKSPKAAKAPKVKVARQRTVAPVVTNKAPKATKAPKVAHPDGTVFFREDRQKWVCVIDNKQPAARPTKEAVIKWMAKKHPNIKPIIVE